MRGFAWLSSLVLLGCGDPGGTPDGSTPTDVAPTETDTETGTTTPPLPTTGDDFCAVRQIFNQSCVVCHGSVDPQGGLDLKTDPWTAIVGVTSAEYGVVIVAPGDPAGSLMWRKMTGNQAPTEGDFMPTTGLLPARAAVIEQWIADGASPDCGTTGGTTTIPPYHPEGWAEPGVHGLATKLQTEIDCRTCHGQDLSGGSSGIACSSCHAPDWETTCTYCHGGVGSTTGAPPEDIDDNADPATISFVPHGVHEAGRISPAYDCAQCHAKPVDVLTFGHLFDDDTPGVAEVSPTPGAYDAATGTCSQQYCHGDGRGANGTVAKGDGPRTCHSCHPDATSSQREIDRMSGRHYIHIPEGLECGECHPSADGNRQIDEPELHVDGTPDVSLPQGMRWDPQRRECTGSCHFERHDRRSW